MGSRMRVLHLDSLHGMRGGQWQALRLVETLSALGVESTLLAPAGAPLYELARKRGLRAEPLGLPRLARLGRRHDLVHAHDARSHTLAALAGGAPLVVSRRVAFAIGDSAASRWKYGRPRRYIAVSEFVKSVLVRGSVGADRIDVVYDGVPLLEPAVPVEPPVILAPDNGGDPRKGAAMAAEAARLAGVEITFSGDLERDLRRASLFVYLTESEGLGSAALLAMSAGVPVIASNVGGLKEAVSNGETGLLVENDPNAIARAIRRLLEDREAAGRLGRRARQTVAERFTIENMARRTLDVYDRVLT
jgi:phosphohistidine swiveling domain-containing protein